MMTINFLGGSLGQLKEFGIRLLPSRHGPDFIENTCRAKGLVYPGGAAFLPEQRGCVAPPE